MRYVKSMGGGLTAAIVFAVAYVVYTSVSVSGGLFGGAVEVNFVTPVSPSLWIATAVGFIVGFVFTLTMTSERSA